MKLIEKAVKECRGEWGELVGVGEKEGETKKEKEEKIKKINSNNSQQ
jgi:hypothetical protein